jgi:hypothetical protein
VFCPKCGAEYREGFAECVDCRVPLTAAPPAERNHREIELVTVFTSGNPALLALAKSLLQGAEIPYLAKGEDFQDVLTVPLTEPVRIQVDSERAEEAAVLLGDLEASGRAEPLAE